MVANILILGGSGFVGSTLRSVLNRNTTNEITIASSRQSELHDLHTNPRFRSVKWDVKNHADITPNFDVIIHAATPASAVMNSTNPSEMLEIIVNGMKNVISFAAAHQKPPTVLLTSSGAVYGTIPHGIKGIPEDAPVSTDSLEESSAYAYGKRAAELLLSAATSSGICRGLIARMFAFSGVHLPLDRHFAVGNFVQDVVSSQTITIRSDGSSIRSYLDGEDMAAWLIRIIEVGDPKAVYHVGSERAISIRELAVLVGHRYELLFSSPVNIQILGQHSPLDGATSYVPSTEWTRKRLNVKETVSLESSVDQMIMNAIVNRKSNFR